ncbi:MAG: transglycosylase domain-containing protein [Hydrogenophaga sp.]
MKSFGRWLLWVSLAGVGLQLFFLARIAMMLVIAPESTAFMRSEIWRIAEQRVEGKGSWQWSNEWLPYERINPHLKRAVMASEDAGFAGHGGVDWDAIQAAWAKNEKRQAIAEKAAARKAEREARLAAQRAKAKNAAANAPAAPSAVEKSPKIVGGSTISQQLAKNLLLSGERNLLRKGQELVLTLMLEAVLSKERILEIYLNSVEWGEGVFGAEAAAQRYFKKSAAQLSAGEAARLAVMLPSPKFFETRPGSAYLSRRAAVITARMGSVALP